LNLVEVWFRSYKIAYTWERGDLTPFEFRRSTTHFRNRGHNSKDEEPVDFQESLAKSQADRILARNKGQHSAEPGLRGVRSARACCPIPCVEKGNAISESRVHVIRILALRLAP
jgi:hypothetical protein